MIGRTLAHYKVTARLGAGGMGEVWRADDTRLGREVALKLLPAEVAADPDRLARFRREAQVLAALDHPNIAGIHALESVETEEDGAQRTVHLLVMQLAEGETLEERIRRGPLPLDEALTVARSIARALEAAHAQGIVHRDLKPANVKIDPAGNIKLLDFGLAKALEPAGPASHSDTALSPTLTSAGTRAGMILGTAAYMSPEQARAREADARADVWAFGCVLYEMLTGARTFDGETVSDILAAVLRKEIRLDALPVATPRAIRRLLRRCLQRDITKRLQSIGDARIEIEETLAGDPAVEDDLAAEAAAGAQAAPRPRRPAILPLAAVAFAAAAATFVLTRLVAPGAAPAAPASEAGTFQQLTWSAGQEIYPRLSPDGNTFVFVAQNGDQLDIHRQRVGGQKPDNLTEDSPDDDTQPAISPDGERIAFRSDRSGGGLFVMGATGESVRRVTEFGYNPAWSPDGERLVFATESVELSPATRGAGSALWEVDVASGETRRLMADGEDAVQPSFSPDGERIAFWRIGGGGGQRDIWTVAAEGGEPVPLTADPPLDWGPVWAPDGKLYFLSDRGGSMNVWRVAVDTGSGEMQGAPEPVTRGVAAGTAHLSLSAAGTRMVFTAGLSRSNILRTRVDVPRARVLAESESITSANHELWSPEPSPDGKWVAYARMGRPEEILVAPSDGSGVARAVVSDGFKNRGPRWSPDGRRLAFYSDRGGVYALWSVQVDGSRLEQLTAPSSTSIAFPIWSPDGRRMAYVEFIGRRSVLSELAADGTLPAGEPLPPYEGPPGHWFEAYDWTPDGRFLVGGIRDDGYRPIAVALYDLAARTHRVLATGELQYPVSSADGKHALATGGDGLVYVVDVATGGVRPLLRVGWKGWTGLATINVSGDGEWLYHPRFEREFDVWMMEFGEGL